jgi:hypothetical protein
MDGWMDGWATELLGQLGPRNRKSLFQTVVTGISKIE